MSAFYDRLEATARRLIKAYGFEGFVVRAGALTGPPHDPQPGEPTRHAARMVEIEYSLINRDATLVERGDKLGLISTEGLAIVPGLPDEIEISGELFHVVDLQPLRPGAQTLLYEFHARK